MPAEDEEKEESMLRRLGKMEQELEKSFAQIRDNLGSIAVAEKDILNLREVQRVMVSDMDQLKAVEKSKFKAVVPLDMMATHQGGLNASKLGQG